MQTLGEAIKAYREKTNMTQTDFGECFGLSDRYIRLIEAGKKFPSGFQTLQMLKFMGIDPKTIKI